MVPGVIICTLDFSQRRNCIYNGLFPGVIIFTMDFFLRSNQIYNGCLRRCHIYNGLFSGGVYSSLDIVAVIVLDLGCYSSVHIRASTGDFIVGKMFGLLDLILYLPVNKFPVMLGRVFLG